MAKIFTKENLKFHKAIILLQKHTTVFSNQDFFFIIKLQIDKYLISDLVVSRTVITNSFCFREFC